MQWKSYGKSTKVKIYVTTTNNFKTGGKDIYKKVAFTKSTNNTASFNVDKFPSEYYKIVIKTRQNTLNKWIVLNK